MREYIGDLLRGEPAIPGARWRLTVRNRTSYLDAIARGWDLKLGSQTPLAEKARLFFENVAGAGLGWPASHPAVGDGGTVFVIDMRLTSSRSLPTVQLVLDRWEDFLTGAEIVRVEDVSRTQGSAESAEAREAEVKRAAAQAADDPAVKCSGITGAAECAKDEVTGFVTRLAIFGALGYLAVRWLGKRVAA